MYCDLYYDITIIAGMIISTMCMYMSCMCLSECLLGGGLYHGHVITFIVINLVPLDEWVLIIP